MASVFSVMFEMCRVPLAFIVIRECRLRDAPSRNQVMVGAGDPEAIQVRFSEALFPAASLAKTNMSRGSSLKLGGVPVTAQEQAISSTLASQLANLVDAAGICPTFNSVTHGFNSRIASVRNVNTCPYKFIYNAACVRAQ